MKKQFTCLFHSQFVSQLFGWCFFVCVRTSVCMCVSTREGVFGVRYS